MFEKYRKAFAVALAAILGVAAQFTPAAAAVGPEVIAGLSGILALAAVYFVENRCAGNNVIDLADTVADMLAGAYIAEAEATGGHVESGAIEGRIDAALKALATPQGHTRGVALVTGNDRVADILKGT